MLLKSNIFLLFSTVFSAKHIQFTHLTDLHYDPSFRKNADEKQHCHSGHIQKSNNFGSQKCDTPLNVIVETIKAIKSLNTQLIFWTGDTARHDSDQNLKRSPEESYSQNSDIAKIFIDYDVNKESLIVPSIGNWDVWPPNRLGDGPNIVLEKIYASWEPLLQPDTEIGKRIKETFHQGGWFSVPLDVHQISIISLNTIYWFAENDAVEDCSLNINDTIPGDKQISWLRKELESLKARNFSAFLIGHVPPIDLQNQMLYYPNCYHHFLETLDLFKEVLIGEFFGHINKDTYMPLLKLNDENNVDPNVPKLKLISLNENSLNDFDFEKYSIINVLQTSASVLPVFNTAFKKGVISLKNENNEQENEYFVKEQSQFYNDLRKSNLVNTFKFEESCQTRETFFLATLKPRDLQGWIKKSQESSQSETDLNLFRRYLECIQVHTERKYFDRLVLSKTGMILFGGFLTFFFFVCILGIYLYTKHLEIVEGDQSERQRLLFRPVTSGRDRYPDESPTQGSSSTLYPNKIKTSLGKKGSLKLKQLTKSNSKSNLNQNN
ncbi:Endopolyphosphatase [Clydaea vesicula]|uniref:Endopolyphosphatase n=1 Tax=Clydaea vesicula TaxID=447962 RepID=A0AAD5U7I6_9FUNG|nr:Endopolyphosphatase [Clydaea vesicula]KAJ3383966.1 Endopolyphosphatase [Lobulomyces angularis]